VSEKHLPDVSADIPRHVKAIINKDKKKPDLRAGKKVKINSIIFAMRDRKIDEKD
jgi:hypothetical protein